MLELNEDTIAAITAHGTRVAGVLLFLFAAWIVAGWTRRLVNRAMNKAEVDPTLGRFVSRAVRSLVLILAFIACLGAFGIETTSFAAVLGAAGLAIGLAFQGSLSNLAAGVMLLVFRPFKVGDVVCVGGHTGKVEEIELFTTRMVTPDNRLIIQPNSVVFGATIENVSHFAERRVDVAVGVDYTADIDRTRQVLESSLAAVSNKISDPGPQVVLTNLGASSVDWVVRVWTKTPHYFEVKESITRAIKVELDRAGIGIPFPQMDVHLNGASLGSSEQGSIGQAV